MKKIVKPMIGILNFIYSVMKLSRIRNKVTFVSRQADEKSEDMEMLEKVIRKKYPDIEQVFLCKNLVKAFFQDWGIAFIF